MRAVSAGPRRAPTDVDGHDAAGSVLGGGRCGIGVDSHGVHRIRTEPVKRPLLHQLSYQVQPSFTEELKHRTRFIGHCEPCRTDCGTTARPRGPERLGTRLVRPFGEAFLYARGTTVFFSGIVKAGAALRLGSGPWKALRFDAEYYLYHSHFDTCQRTVGIFCSAMNLTQGVQTTAPELQRDLVLSLGLAIRVGGT